MHCVACVRPRMFRKATYKGENFDKAVNEFVKESTNHGRSVRLQRETVYHMYASQRIAAESMMAEGGDGAKTVPVINPEEVSTARNADAEISLVLRPFECERAR